MTETVDIAGITALEDTRQALRQAAWNSNRYIPLIVERLKTINPHKIILFGSYAYGNPDVDSDIDLIVVLNQKGVTKTYQEKFRKRLTVNKKLLDIEREVSLDTLVYTRDEWALFLSQNSSFSKFISHKGIVLYEANNPGVAQ